MTLGLLNSFVQFLDEKSPLVERRHHGDKIVCISKFEPLHARKIPSRLGLLEESDEAVRELVKRRFVEETCLKI